MVPFAITSTAFGRFPSSCRDDRDCLYINGQSSTESDRYWFFQLDSCRGDSARILPGPEDALVWHHKQQRGSESASTDSTWALQWRAAGIVRYTWYEMRSSELARLWEEQRAETLPSCSHCRPVDKDATAGPDHRWTVFSSFRRSRIGVHGSSFGTSTVESPIETASSSRFIGWCSVQDSGRTLQVFDWQEGTLYSVSIPARGEWLVPDQSYRRSVTSLYASLQRSTPTDPASLTLMSSSFRESARMSSPSSSWLHPSSMVMPAALNARALIQALFVLPMGLLVAMADGRKLILRHPLDDLYELEELEALEQVVFTDAHWPVLVTQQCHAGSGASLAEFHTIRVYLLQDVDTESHRELSSLESRFLRLTLVWEQGFANPRETLRAACLAHPWMADPQQPLLCLLIGQTLRGLAVFALQPHSARGASAEMVFLQHHVEAVVAIEALRPGFSDLLVIGTSPKAPGAPWARLQLQIGSLVIGHLQQPQTSAAAVWLSNAVGSRFTLTLADNTQYRMCLGRMIREPLPFMHLLLKAIRRTLPSAFSLKLHLAFMEELLASSAVISSELETDEMTENVHALWRALQNCQAQSFDQKIGPGRDPTAAQCSKEDLGQERRFLFALSRKHIFSETSRSPKPSQNSYQSTGRLAFRRTLPHWLWFQRLQDTSPSPVHEMAQADQKAWISESSSVSEQGHLSLSPLRLAGQSGRAWQAPETIPPGNAVGICSGQEVASRSVPKESQSNGTCTGSTSVTAGNAQQATAAGPALTALKSTVLLSNQPSGQVLDLVCELTVSDHGQTLELPWNTLLDTLHAVYEAFKLDQACWPYLQPMARLLKAIAIEAGSKAFWEYYQRDVPERIPLLKSEQYPCQAKERSLEHNLSGSERINDAAQAPDVSGSSALHPGVSHQAHGSDRASITATGRQPPSILRWLQDRLPLLVRPSPMPSSMSLPLPSCGMVCVHHPHPLTGSAQSLGDLGQLDNSRNPLGRMVGLIRLFDRLEQWHRRQEEQCKAQGAAMDILAPPQRPDGTSMLSVEHQRAHKSCSRQGSPRRANALHDVGNPPDEQIEVSALDALENTPPTWSLSLANELVQWMLEAHLDSNVLARLPVSIALPLQLALGQARAQPRPEWQASAYALIGRDDLAPCQSQRKWIPPAGRLLALPEPELAMLRLQGGLVTDTNIWASSEKPGETLTSNLWLGQAQGDTNAISGRSQDGVLWPGPRPQSSLPRTMGPAGRHAEAQWNAEDHIQDEVTDRMDDRATDDADSSQMDGCELPNLLPWLRFRSDRRLWEVQRLLRSSVPIILDAAPERSSTEQDAAQTTSTLQQAALFASAQCTLAAPVGRGAFTAWTGNPDDAANGVLVPPLVLAGRFRTSPLLVQLDASALTPSYFEWSEFHNAVAAGLRLRPTQWSTEHTSTASLALRSLADSPTTVASSHAPEMTASSGLANATITRAWILQQRPSRPTATHAGLLLALGLNGHLVHLQVTDWYAYLLPRHELTSIALLLGLAASYRGSAHPLVARLVGLHIRAFNPTGFVQPDWDVSPAVQTAAVMAMGLLFASTGRKAILEGLVTELVQGAAASSSSAVSGGATAIHGNPRTWSTSRDREAHALAAGLALGLIALSPDDSDAAAVPSSAQTTRIPSSARRYVDGLLSLVTRTGAGDHGETQDVSRTDPASTTMDRTRVIRGQQVLPDATTDPYLQTEPGATTVDTMMVATSSLTAGRPFPETFPPHQAAGTGELVPDARPSVLLEPERARGDVASVGALYALTLWYLQSNAERITRRLGLPRGGRTALWQIRPELVLLRSMAAALIRWESISPNWAWMLSELPPVLADQWQLDRSQERAAMDVETETRATLDGQQGKNPKNVRVIARWLVALSNDPIDPTESVPNTRHLSQRVSHGQQDDLGSSVGRESVPNSRNGFVSSPMTSSGPSPRETRLDSLPGTRNFSPRTALARLYTLLAITGQAFALGIKMAGTANEQAKQLLTELLRLVDKRYVARKNSSAAPWLICCVDNIAMALALVCAGHGTLSVMRLLRQLYVRRRGGHRRHPSGRPHEPSYAYGNHLALQLALGLLFLGGGTLTLGSSRRQTAMLLAALYPRYPAAPSDNQYHLQALRHCYVLAMEARCLETRDIDTNAPCAVPVEIIMAPMGQTSAAGPETRRFLRWTPCLLPAWSTWTKLEVHSPRYWPVTVTAMALQNTRPVDADHLHHVLYVKRHVGHLSYLRDRRGVKGLASRSFQLRSSGKQPSADWMQLFATDPLVMALLRYALAFRDDQPGGMAALDDSLPDETRSSEPWTQPERHCSGRVQLGHRDGYAPCHREREESFHLTEASFWRLSLDRCLEADRMGLWPLLVQLYDEAHRGRVPGGHTLSLVNQVVLQHWAWAASAASATTRTLSPERCLEQWCWSSIMACRASTEGMLNLDERSDLRTPSVRRCLLQRWLQEEDACWQLLQPDEAYQLASLLQLIQVPPRTSLSKTVSNALLRLDTDETSSTTALASLLALLEAQHKRLKETCHISEHLNLLAEWMPTASRAKPLRLSAQERKEG
jgi:hypothetical protein